MLGIDPQDFLFWLVALTTVLCAVSVVVTQNIVRAATWLLFTLAGDKITHYREVFDRGVALVQQDFDAERLRKILSKTAARINAGDGAQEHLARLRS